MPAFFEASICRPRRMVLVLDGTSILGFFISAIFALKNFCLFGYIFRIKA